MSFLYSPISSTMEAANAYMLSEILKNTKGITGNDNSSVTVIVTPDSLLKTNTLRPYVGLNPYRGNVNLGYYNDLNEDKRVIKTITKYFYFKILDKWFYDNLFTLLAFVKINEKGEPYIIKNLKDYHVSSLTKDSQETIDEKINFLSNILISKTLVHHVLKKIVNKYNIKWYQLNKSSEIVKKVMYKYLKGKLEDMVDNKYYHDEHKKDKEEEEESGSGSGSESDSDSD